MDSRTFPPRSTHTSWFCGVPEPVRYVNVPVSETEKLGAMVSNATCSAIGTASPVVGEFRKRPEFYGLLNLIPSCPCATFSLLFCMRSSPSSGSVDPVDSVPFESVLMRHQVLILYRGRK